MNEIFSFVGNTSLVELKNIQKKYQLKSKIFAKLELMNPTGSIKDRPAFKMVNDAINKGILKDDSILIEATSGNMGISLAYVGMNKKIDVTIVMPSNMSKERISMMEKYNAKVILTDPSLGMQGSIDEVKRLMKENNKIVHLNQFENMSNKYSHYDTGKEILTELPNIDIFVTGIGTGGTISGVGETLKQNNPSIKVIGVEPITSPLIKKGYSGNHNIQGIGPNVIPKILNKNIIDDILLVSNEDAYEYSAVLAKVEGIECGISSGANLKAAIDIAKDKKDKNIVIIIQDRKDRYYSLNY